MHMRKQAEQRGVVRQRALHFHPKVIRAGGNDEGVIVELQCENALPRGRLGKHQSDAGAVAYGHAVRGVVQQKKHV